MLRLLRPPHCGQSAPAEKLGTIEAHKTAAPNRMEVVFFMREFDLIAPTVFKRKKNSFILFIDLERANMIQNILWPSHAECFVDKE